MENANGVAELRERTEAKWKKILLRRLLNDFSYSF